MAHQTHASRTRRSVFAAAVVVLAIVGIGAVPAAAQYEREAPRFCVSQDVVTRLNIRSGPGLDHPIIGKLYPGRCDLILGPATTVDWLHVFVEGLSMDGWVSMRFVHPATPMHPPQPIPLPLPPGFSPILPQLPPPVEAMNTLCVATGEPGAQYLNLRSHPGTDGTVRARIALGNCDLVALGPADDDWLLVRWGSFGPTRTGWLPVDAIRVTGTTFDQPYRGETPPASIYPPSSSLGRPSRPTPVPVVAPPVSMQQSTRACVTGVSEDGWLNLRTAPTTAAPVVATLSPQMCVVSACNSQLAHGWRLVSVGEIEGWASVEFLRVDPCTMW